MCYSNTVISPLFIEAGLTGMLSGSGLLGEGPLPDRVHVPGYVAIEGDQLVWSWLHPDAPDPFHGGADFPVVVAIASEIPLDVDTSDWTYEFLHHTRPHYNIPRGMLDAFVRIRNGHGVVRFASRFGVLGICGHGLPHTHNAQCPLMYATPRTWNPVYWEPLDRWLYYANYARSMLSVASAMHQGEKAQAEDWTLLYEGVGGLGVPEEINKAFRQMPSLAQTFFAYVVNWWMRIGGVSPSLSWGGPAHPEPQFRLTAGTFGLLGVQLMAAVTRSQDVYICDGCGLPYLRDGRKPQAGRRNYCGTCGEREANRQRQRKWRSKQQKSTLRREQ
jgi:hypothetical protein